ncbi:cytochrome c biogenesis heme-transporting ATPase CcmA [Massilia agri]|uniref:Cytochrome c biogenesis heme-transporting ATPase CcmA n=1 Tax=Massilia agri TaxID=1886785 RepID=A0ABT2ALX4_9BURK|nr:cytochrome c biogenesis heme-transporting ATPase CcmA [Massilia agri]MCS0597252.1 cytochrome c biogenesis heme-transporting ATPase CcmA [Massilia agri]
MQRGNIRTIHEHERRYLSLVCHKLGCRRGNRTLFTCIEFSLEAGEVLRIDGDNGSGKTSLLRILAGLRQADTGHVSWQGTDVRNPDGHLRQDLLYIGHAAAVKDSLMAWENLACTELLTGQAGKTLALDALAKAGLSSHAYTFGKALSQGQRRRVALARLHVPRNRTLWILDEPFIGLDSGAVDALCASMHAHRRNGGTIVYTSHQDAGPPDIRSLRLVGAG